VTPSKWTSRFTTVGSQEPDHSDFVSTAELCGNACVTKVLGIFKDLQTLFADEKSAYG
jgi:hypothetical protein